MQDKLVLNKNEMDELLSAYSFAGCVFSGCPWFFSILFPTGGKAFVYGENGNQIISFDN